MPKVKPLTPITDYSRLGRENLKTARKEKGLTQQQVADQLHICLRHYKYIESGKVLGSIEIWDKLEDMFNIHQRVLREIHHGIKENR